jgi:ankyrin repeat protein
MRHRGFWLSLGALVAAWSTLIAAQGSASRLYDAIRTNDLARLQTMVHSAADANTKDDGGKTPLMYAAAVGSIDAVKLLIDKGADVNAQNESGLTALMLASTDLAKVRLLVDRGANVNATTKLGRTALFLAAMSDDSAAIVRLLVAKGADVKVRDMFKNTMLNAATAGNDTETIRLVIDAGVDVNAAATTGLTPLMLAAGQSNVRAAKLLLAKGANVNAVAAAPFMYDFPPPKSGPVVINAYTPLLMAAAFGPPELIQMLLDAGANVNASESRKLTPLMLAVASDHQDPAVIRLLLARGADPTPKSALGLTAANWATKVGAPAAIDILHAERPRPPVRPSNTDAPLELTTAVERSVALLEKSSQGFFAGSGCVSCHAQSITDLAVAEARAKGVRVDAQAAQDRIKMIQTAGFPVDVLYEHMDIRVPEIVAYQLAGLAAVGYPPDPMTDAMASHIAASQNADGAFHIPFGVQQRPGGEDGDIFRTALSIRSLKAYGSPGRGPEMQARIAKARGWLLQAKPVTQEDRNMQLLGLAWAGASGSTLRQLAEAILAEQQADGGWRQREGLGSDAYATGESLYALATAGGVAPSDPAYQKGVRFLLTTQSPSDGSWRVETRTPKFQTFFQSGFPYAEHQWISSWATGWATMALAQAIETPVKRVAR